MTNEKKENWKIEENEIKRRFQKVNLRRENHLLRENQLWD